MVKNYAVKKIPKASDEKIRTNTMYISDDLSAAIKRASTLSDWIYNNYDIYVIEQCFYDVHDVNRRRPDESYIRWFSYFSMRKVNEMPDTMNIFDKISA